MAGHFGGRTVTEKIRHYSLRLYVNEGESVEAGAVSLSAVGISADKLQQAWKVVQLGIGMVLWAWHNTRRR